MGKAGRSTGLELIASHSWQGLFGGDGSGVEG